MFTDGEHERGLEGQTGRVSNDRLRALNLNLQVMGSHASTCLPGCLRASSADKVLRTKESYQRPCSSFL